MQSIKFEIQIEIVVEIHSLHIEIRILCILKREKSALR